MDNIIRSAREQLKATIRYNEDAITKLEESISEQENKVTLARNDIKRAQQTYDLLSRELS